MHTRFRLHQIAISATTATTEAMAAPTAVPTALAEVHHQVLKHQMPVAIPLPFLPSLHWHLFPRKNGTSRRARDFPSPSPHLPLLHHHLHLHFDLLFSTQAIRMQPRQQQRHSLPHHSAHTTHTTLVMAPHHLLTSSTALPLRHQFHLRREADD